MTPTTQPARAQDQALRRISGERDRHARMADQPARRRADRTAHAAAAQALDWALTVITANDPEGDL